MKFKLINYKAKIGLSSETERQFLNITLHKDSKIFSAELVFVNLSLANGIFKLSVSYAEPEFQNKAFLDESREFQFVVYKRESDIEDLHELRFLSFSHRYFVFLKVVP